MEQILKSTYESQLPGLTVCSIGSKNKNKDEKYSNINFYIELNGKGFLNTTISVVNNDLIFTIIEMRIKETYYQYLLDLSANLKIIEKDLKQKLKPYFGI